MSSQMELLHTIIIIGVVEEEEEMRYLIFFSFAIDLTTGIFFLCPIFLGNELLGDL